MKGFGDGALNVRLSVTLLAISVVFSGCFTPASKTTLLRPGMTTKEVTEILGAPKSTQFVDGYLIWKYSLQRWGVGLVPHYLAFDGKTMQLTGWKENMQEYYASQSLWLQAMPKQHNVNVTGSLDHNVQGNIQHDVNER